MATKSDSRFELRRISSVEWVIRDHNYQLNHPRNVVAFVWQIEDDECDVTWLRDLALPSRFPSLHEVFDEVCNAPPRRQKPIPIPHLPPPALTRADAAMRDRSVPA